MRTFIIAGAVAVAAVLPFDPCSAQQSALGTRLSDYGGFLGLDLRFGDMADEFAAFAGGEAALLLKQRVYLGLRGSGLATDNARLPGSDPSVTDPLRMGYGGFLLGYIVHTPALFDVSVDALVGAGGLHAGDSNDDEDWDAVFVFEPSVTAEVKVALVARIGIGIAYRFVGDVDVPGIREADVRGLTGVVRVRAGWF